MATVLLYNWYVHMSMDSFCDLSCYPVAPFGSKSRGPRYPSVVPDVQSRIVEFLVPFYNSLDPPLRVKTLKSDKTHKNIACPVSCSVLQIYL